jgi:DUF3072 family protein
MAVSVVRRIVLTPGTPPALKVSRSRSKREETMVDRRTQEEEGSNKKKDPDDWTTGDEPMTGAQRSYMHTLAEEAHEEVQDDLTKAEASKKIEELQEKTGRKPPSTG